MAFFSRRKLRPMADEVGGELNIVPYLDILMNLIIFMLLSMAGLATYGALKVSAPASGPRGVTPPGLTLTVAISRTGFVLLGDEASEALIAKTSDGAYDYVALTARVRELKARYPAEQRLFIAADADTSYEALVSTLDATRASFPEVTLASF